MKPADMSVMPNSSMAQAPSQQQHHQQQLFMDKGKDTTNVQAMFLFYKGLRRLYHPRSTARLCSGNRVHRCSQRSANAFLRRAVEGQRYFSGKVSCFEQDVPKSPRAIPVRLPFCDEHGEVSRTSVLSLRRQFCFPTILFAWTARPFSNFQCPLLNGYCWSVQTRP